MTGERRAEKRRGTPAEFEDEQNGIVSHDRGPKYTTGTTKPRLPAVRSDSSQNGGDLTLLRSHSGESSHQLLHSFASAVRARNLRGFAVRHVETLGKPLLAIAAVENVLRHGRSPARS